MKTKHLLFTLLTMLLPLVSWADVWQDPKTKVNYEYTVESGVASVKGDEYGYTGYTGSPDAKGNITILSEITVGGRKYSVTSIGIYAFRKCIGLTSVTIPNSVTSIGSWAFENCYGLTSVTIPNSVTSIGSWAFGYCRGLTSVTIPNSVTSIGYGAFYGCSGLTSITIPNSVTIIEGNAFGNCRGLTSVTIPNSVTSIGGFSGCSSLTSITIPNSVTSIEDYAFSGCSSLTSVTIPNSVTSIGNGAFRDCRGLTSVTIPNSVTSIGSSAFSGCSSLTSVTIPNGVTRIGGFSGCSSLTSITIPNSVTIIEGSAFEGCTGLTSVTIGNSVRSIGGGAFKGCTGLTSITIPNSVTRIWDSAFKGCSSLTSITIPNSVTSIGSSAFSETGWYNNLSDGILYLDNWLLGYKGEKPTGLLMIVEGTKGIADYAFSGCSSLTSVTIPNSVTSIGNSAFEDCSSLTSVMIPNSVTIIGGRAFENCYGLTSVTIPNSVTIIGSWAFFGCSSLTSVTSLIEKPFDISGVFSNDTYDSAILYVPDGTQEAYNVTNGWKDFKKILVIEGGSTTTLITIDENESDLTDQVNVTWYDTNGNQIGTGKSINGIKEGTELYYSVTFGEELGRVYREVNMQKVVVDGETVTCQLKKIGRVQLEGRVSATDIDKTTMTVDIKQMLNGKWEQTYTVQTNEQGVFKVEAYDDVTDITISGDGYLDAILHRDGFGGNGNVGVIPMSLISGFAIAANINVQKAVAEGEAEEMTTWTDVLNNIDFTLTNTTNGAAVTDFTVQNGNVIIKTGAGVGDNISLTAKSKQGMFADATTTFTIADGANAFDLQLTELGGFDATCAVSNNGSTSGYLYNSNDVLVAKGSYVGETLSLRHLKSGVYTLISMGNSSLLGSMTRLSDLTAVGLTEGTDYVSTRIDVVDGELAAVNVSEVPQLDETHFYYTNNNSYFSANKASVTAGNYLTLQAHMDFKQQYADRVDGVTLTIDLPEGCEMVENSVIANRQAVAHTVNGSRVTMTLNKEQFSSQVRFCVIPTLNQNYTITAMAQFDIDGQVTQPIGTAQFEAKGLSLSVPELTANTNVTVNGTAKGHSEVSIYDNDVLIGKTSSKADGSWTAACELYKPYSHSFHDIYAKITTGAGMELTSETQQVEYYKNRIVPEKVTMLYYGSKTEFDLLYGTTSPSYYTYVPSIHDFTFLADFTRNDSTVIKNVNIKVLNSDGTVRTLPASFDGKQNKWVATTNYSNSSRLPKNVKVEYNLIPIEEPYDSIRIKDDIRQNMNMILNYIANVDSTNCAIIEDTDSMFLAQYQTTSQNVPVYIRTTILNYDEWIDKLQKDGYITMDNGTTITFYRDSVMSDRHVSWIWTSDAKILLQIELSQSKDIPVFSLHEVNASRRTPWWQSVFDGVIPLNIFAIREIVRDWEHGYQEYEYWLSYYSQVVSYHGNLRSNTEQMLNAKCPDGSLRLPNSQYDWGKMYLDIYWDDSNRFWSDYKRNVERVKYELDTRRDVASAITAFLSLISIPSINEYIQLFGGQVPNWLSRVLGNQFVDGATKGLVNGGISELLQRMLSNWYTAEQFSNWYTTENAKIVNRYNDLQASIERAYKKCQKKKEEEKKDEEEKDEEEKDEPRDEKSDNNNDFRGKGSTPQIDPSGYVYEAVMSNRLEGVTATCYQKVQVEDMYGDMTEEAVVWNAADYSQVNPQKTDATGFYRWDVPQGMWQVKYEKEGYETAYSDWLPVPPPQLDVNIGMKQSTPPTVTQMRGFESGINIEMAKYMRPETMTTANITVTRNGAAEKGSIELLNTEKAPLGEETYVSKVRFVPENHFNTTDLVVVTVHKEVESYCGVTMTKDHVETVKIEPEVKSIVCDSVLTIPYQGTKELRVLVLPKDASAGKTLYVKTSSQMIASLSAEEVTIDQNGTATLTLGGELPGGAVLDYSVSGTDVTATSKVKVVMNRELVAAPMANISSGETIESGTLLVLTCETEGATIYYTLDGSCPCDEATRYKYEGPIVIATDVIVKAIAVKDGMDDSEIVTFIYIVSGIQTPAFAQNLNITCIDGLMTIAGAVGCTVRVFDVAGRNLASRQNAGRKVTVRVPQSEEYIVSVTTKDGHTVVRKIIGR